MQRRDLLFLLMGLGAACSMAENSPELESASQASPPIDDPLLLTDGPALFLVDASGRQKLLELGSGSVILDPSVSLQDIAFAVQPPSTRTADGSVDFGSDLYVAARKGGSPSLVVRHSQIAEFVRGPAWLRPERLLFDVRGRRQDGSGDFRIEVLNTATKKRERFLDAAISPAVSPDGKWIACVSLDVETGQENILVMDSDRGNVSRLLGEFSSKLFIGSLAWSPDGNDLAFAAADPFAKSLPRERRSQLVSLAHPTLKDVWLIRRDGSNLRRLADLGESQPSVAWASNPKFVYVLGFRGLLKFNVESGAFEERGAGTYGGQIASVPR